MAPQGFPRWLTHPPVLYGLVSLAAFSPCLLGGQAYFDNDLLAQFGPWRAFLKDQLAQGHFPLWNPYLLGGQPFFADLQNMMLYPLNWLTLPFSVPYGLSVFFFLHFFLAALGMHLWLRSFGLSENACRVGALVYASSNFFWWEIIHPPVLAAFAWLPWLFLLLELLVKNPKPVNAFYAGFCFALIFLCGSFQVTLGAFYGGMAYLLVRCFQRRKSSSPFNFSTLPLLTLVFVWGALPLLGQFIPTLQFSLLSERYAQSQNGTGLSETTSLNPSSLYQFIFPRMGLDEGRSIDNAVQETDQNRFRANDGYLGPWVPFLLAMAFFRKDKKLLSFLAGLCVVSIFISFGKYFPIYHYLGLILPGLSLIHVPFRYLFLYSLGASALAAFGFGVLEDLTPGRLRPLLKWGAAYAAVLYGAALLHPSRTKIEIAGLVLGAAGGALLYFPKDGRNYGLCLFLASLILPLFWTGLTDFPTGPASNFNFKENSSLLEKSLQDMGPYRLYLDFRHVTYPIQVRGKDYLLDYPQDAACVLGFKNFGGYNPLHLDSASKIRTLPMAALVPLMGIRGIVSGIDQGPIPGFVQKSTPHFYWYEYGKPLPYVFAPNRLQASWARFDLDWLQKPDFDPYQTAFFPMPLPQEWLRSLGSSYPVDENNWETMNYPKPSHLQYQWVEDGIDHQGFEITLDKDRVVVFSEIMYPGWKAWVDGKPSPIVTADYCLRSLEVPAGHHEVEFRFEPGWWIPIQVGLGLWLLGTLTGLLLAFKPKGRRRA